MAETGLNREVVTARRQPHVRATLQMLTSSREVKDLILHLVTSGGNSSEVDSLVNCPHLIDEAAELCRAGPLLRVTQLD